MARSQDILAAYLGISRHSPPEGVLRLLIELGAQFVGAEEGSLLVLDEGKQELAFAMTVGSDSSQAELLGRRVPLGEGITGLAAQTHEVQIGAPAFDTGQTTDPRSVLAAPMLIGDRLIGVLTAITRREGKRFGSNDALLYARVATVAAVVVDQHRRLTAAEAIQAGQDLPAASDSQERLDRQILDSARRLVQSRPADKQRTAAVLSNLADLMAG